MSVVIIGGNECMTRRYMDLCKKYNCKAKVFPKMSRGLKNFGKPDLMILFTSTVSHNLVRTALGQVDDNTVVERCHTSSMQALKNILETHTAAQA